jgi:glycosyltransferase involved in cell wall biosynthesis
MRVLFFVEGFTDIRFVVGLSEVCDLTVAVPRHAYLSSGLDERVRASGARVTVDQIDGGRLAFQARSLGYLWKRAGDFDVVLAQEMLRGALNATLVGAVKGVPVVTYMGISPIEYFRCRRERGQIGALAAWGGELVIRTLMRLNGALAARALVMGPYLAEVVAPFSDRVAQGRYYGVDTSMFRPAGVEERASLRKQLDLPPGRFVVLLSSRISHEKDPETVLRAVAMIRDRGVDAVVLNLGGGHREFLALAGSLGLPAAEDWVLARPAVHPMNGLADYYRAADVLAQGSLEEGLGLSPLEALACDTPVVATAIGGMAAHLGPYADLTPRRDAPAMADALMRVAVDPAAARTAAARGRAYVDRHWTRAAAFRELRGVLADVVQERVAARPGEEHA